MWRSAAVLVAVAALAPAATAGNPGQTAIGYICGAEQTVAGSGPRTLVRMDGVGNSRLKIDANPEAQAWFDFGLQLADGFYHEDAKAAFARAVAADPDCAMCLWGQAWGLGGTLNFPVSAGENAEALKVIGKAERLAGGASERDRALIAAMKLRYLPASKDHNPDRAFAQAMDAVVRRWPDAQLEVMAAQGWMMPIRRGDRSGTERAIQLLDGVLKREPDHVGAIHFYIHATEFAGRAGVALPYAEKLAQLAPQASHLVHMPAHTLFRVGRYHDAGVLNAQALGVEARYRKALNAPGALGSAAYYGHNYSFGLAGALMAGDAPLALKFADHVAVAYPMTLPAQQRDTAIARSYVALGRFAPERALAIPEPGKDKAALQLFRHYARGEAAAARGDQALLRHEIAALGALKAPAGPMASQIEDMRTVAKDVLAGRAAMLAGDTAAAVAAYSRAADIQDSKLKEFFDPPPWWYPVRRSLAAALLQQGQYADAAAEAERSLAGWPNDALALRVLAQAQEKLGRRDEARGHLARAGRSWEGADPSDLPLALI